MSIAPNQARRRHVWEKEIQRGALAKHGPAAIAVALTLATFGDPDGDNIYPSQATLAEALGVSERYVRKQLDILKVAGTITEVGKTRDGVKRYRLTLQNNERTDEQNNERTNERNPGSDNHRTIGTSRPEDQETISLPSEALSAASRGLRPLTATNRAHSVEDQGHHRAAGPVVAQPAPSGFTDDSSPRASEKVGATEPAYGSRAWLMARLRGHAA